MEEFRLVNEIWPYMAPPFLVGLLCWLIYVVVDLFTDIDEEMSE